MNAVSDEYVELLRGKLINICNFLWKTQAHWYSCMCTHSIMSDSLGPHALYPARLLHPWDSPGRNNGVGCHALLQGIFLTQGSNLSLWPLLHWQMDSLPFLTFLYWATFEVTDTHCSTIYNSQDIEATKVSINRSINKKTWCTYIHIVGFPRGSVVKNPPANAGDMGLILWSKDPLKEEMASQFSILAWEIPQTEEPGGLQFMGWQKNQTWLSD